MMRITGPHLLVPLLIVCLVAACADTGAPIPSEPVALRVPIVLSDARGHGTHLTGDEEVPANASAGQGQAQFRLSDDGLSLRYKLNVANIENVTQAHIHLAAAGINGPIVVWLYPSAPPSRLIPGRTQGTLGEGTITAANLVGPLTGRTLESLLAAIGEGRTYVNVHTSQRLPGEIRGQIR